MWAKTYAHRGSLKCHLLKKYKWKQTKWPKVGDW